MLRLLFLTHQTVIMIRKFLVFIMTGLTLHATAQTMQDSVKQAVEQLFTAMRTKDTSLLRQCFGPNAVLQTITKDKTGNLVVSDEKVDAFAISISGHEAGSLDERISFEAIHIDGPMAAVWTPYQFYYKGNFSHCGVNSFQLVRLDGSWKIQYIIDTRRKANCE